MPLVLRVHCSTTTVITRYRISYKDSAAYCSEEKFISFGRLYLALSSNSCKSVSGDIREVVYLQCSSLTFSLSSVKRD